MTTPRSRALGALLFTALLAGACDDPFDDGATTPTIDATLETWSVNGSPPAFPSALLVPQVTVVRPDAVGSFDIAFEITADGRLRVLPVSRVVLGSGSGRAIGLLRATGTFTEIVDAPRTGWAFDTVMTFNPGQTFLVKVQTQFCQFEIRQDIYAKFYVDVVDPVGKRAVLITRVNPNCGFRSLLPGIPEY